MPAGAHAALAGGGACPPLPQAGSVISRNTVMDLPSLQMQ